MKVYLGKKGLSESWQEPFPEVVKCHKCKGKARIMFVGFEGMKQKEYIVNLHDTTGKKGGLWFHDAVSVAVYACRNCLEVTALANQA